MYYIYRITNLVNGKTYIGQHKYKDLNDDYMGSGKRLGYAKKKYGIENFKKEILVFNISKQEHANILEQTFIAAEREKVGRENCYNITDGGDGFKGMEPWNKGKKGVQTAWNKGESSWSKGKHLSEEHRKKIGEANSVALKGHTPWNKGKKGQIAWNKGVPHTEETKRKIAESKKGKPLSEEQKKKMKGRTPGNKGMKWFNNGEINKYCYECPDGFTPGMLKRKKGDR